MKKTLSVMLLLAISSAAAEPLLVSLDPLPYGAIQLAYNQYLIPNIGGMNVLLYSSAPLTFSPPGQTLTPKATLSLSPLPFGAVRMNDSQYMIPAVMPGVMALVVSATPLNFAASLLAIQTPGVNPPTTATPTPSPAPAIAALEAKTNTTASLPPLPTKQPPTAALPQPTPTKMVTAVAVQDTPAPTATSLAPKATPAAVATTPDAPKALSVASTTPDAPKATFAASTTPAGPKPAPDAPKAAPVATTPDAPKAPFIAALPRERGEDAAPLTTEVKSSTRLPRLPGLPDDLTGSVTITQHSNKVTFSYTLTSLSTTTYTLNPTALRLTQDGLGVRARLDRRNGNLTPGTLAPGKGEIGTITVNRATSADVQLTWLITDNAGHTYTLKATTAQQSDALSVQ
ncbi:hypothetical protein EHF33_15540 [Deinococcus psychrotolerans]|uniref:Uncharacterized protein n=1 Tax=Deinococcus psychrotolerans TaxID=2489213 RepID=A0A3G8YRD2_9DEIO|nr:hypothetical protein [Deinococcus psychrotolerans]AZI44301.1 hypothetical protein EHF33_15540 [Deinococcus psychrotolerans]